MGYFWYNRTAGGVGCYPYQGGLRIQRAQLNDSKASVLLHEEKGMISFCPEDKRDRVAMWLLDGKDSSKVR
ncbi:hypothetical protein [Sphingobacterium prati]|uniref:hypothetical protein n=1 Tax=Sphingobacterium prati TaxID=2737006 RepID=UPI0015580FE4|nr:hypothetical protein [Sphingobacterium prati]NPE44769.1 hypothetical protein [Sphingobacterium prati]